MEKKWIETLEGIWQARMGDGTVYEIRLPGTLDENGIGHRDTGSNQWHPDAQLGNAEEGFSKEGPISTRFTRRYTFEGEAEFVKKVALEIPEGKRIFLEAERARCLKLMVDGQKVPDFIEPSISTPHVFEVTEFFQQIQSGRDSEHELVLLSDNSYPGLPYDAITYSSAATDETQTNWNGVLGKFNLRLEEGVFIEAVRVYPVRDKITVKVDICANQFWHGDIRICSEALREQAVREVEIQLPREEIVFEKLPLREGILLWDEYQGNLYDLTAALSGGRSKTVRFGVRDFSGNHRGRLALNGRTIFLRSETNCAVFPETGHVPMTRAEWLDILTRYQAYGINLVRFHSHCPPEAAFVAADELGMLMQPELSHWNPKDAFETQESYEYYRAELVGILKMLANHPSFVMLTLGNELHASKKGHGRMQTLLELARREDATRLYADGSNVHYGEIGCDEGSDFYASQKYYEEDLRGTYSNMEGYINQRYPSAMTNYQNTMKHLREAYQKPVFTFEVGQFEVLPDFEELEAFQGVTEPVNLRLIQEKVKAHGLTGDWKKYVEATGELAKICYREEIEAVMRTEELSGISLLGLQDFPGQGTALVGMLNSHMQPKPYEFAKPEKFKAFFTDKLPLVLLPKYTYENTETLKAGVLIANYGRTEIVGKAEYVLKGKHTYIEGVLAEKVLCPVGELTQIPGLEVSLADMKNPQRLNLTVFIGSVKNTYPIWVYPKKTLQCPENVYETTYMDEGAKEILKEGGIVYLTPPSTKEALPNSIQAQFSTDFWSVGTFTGQEGGMGQLIDAEHPIFKKFPTEFHTNWHWWMMAKQRAVVLPKQYQCIITEMDSYAYLRPMAQLLECRCGNGKLLFSTLGLQNLQQYPEARALLSSLYEYLASEAFLPKQEIAVEIMEQLVHPVSSTVKKHA